VKTADGVVCYLQSSRAQSSNTVTTVEIAVKMDNSALWFAISGEFCSRKYNKLTTK
jgi:hypothetical protein